MNIESVIENEMVRDQSLVWVLKGHDRFGYSDGLRSEQYLERVFRSATDLGTGSSELESYIKDWASEYHLSRKRAQLLSGFRFDRSMKVLEVGCGCGAITRHLGENFDQVVSVEGSLPRARLARLRTRDLESVQVVCAPFQEIKFKEKFDIVFCVGVYEYAASFVSGDDPYTSVLEYFSEMLSSKGVLVIAIENQFGLKYFVSSSEDHLGTMFEGLEGYHRRPGVVRTFGRRELECRLRSQFADVQFFYPYPDYKMPDCVVTDEFLATGAPGELLSQLRSRDYSGERAPLWDESAMVMELSRNQALDFFSNSFLVLASKGKYRGIEFPQHAIIFSPARRPLFSTMTRVTGDLDGRMLVSKRRVYAAEDGRGSRLQLRDTQSDWIDGLSLQTVLALRSKNVAQSLEGIFQPCRAWVAELASASFEKDGVRYLPGDHVDSIWSNAYVSNAGCVIVDREWSWDSPIRTNVVVIRAIFDFLEKVQRAPIQAGVLASRSGQRLITAIARTFGVILDHEDFARFIELEAEIQELAFGVPRGRTNKYLHWYLVDRPTLQMARRLTRALTRIRDALFERGGH